MMHLHRTSSSAHGFNAESRLVFRRGNNYPQQQPQYMQQPQGQPQMQNRVVQNNAYQYQIDNRLSVYAKGCKEVYLGRMNKIREHVASKGDAVSQENKDWFKKFDTYFQGDFAKWIERYEQRIENNAVALEENLKKCENAIDKLEKQLYSEAELPLGKVFSKRSQERMEEVAIENGIAVESAGIPGEYIIDVPSAWGIQFNNATPLPKKTLAISGGRTRLHFDATANSSVNITIGDVTIQAALRPGQTISLKSYKDTMEARQVEAKLKAETDARGAVDAKAAKIDETIQSQELHRTRRNADGTPVGPLNQIPSDKAKMEVDAIKEVKATLEAQKGILPEDEYTKKMKELSLQESAASRKELTLTVQEAVRLMREGQPEAAQKKLDEVQSRYKEIYGIFIDPETASRVFQEDNISQLSAEEGYKTMTGKNIEGGMRVPRAKGDQPFKLIYEGMGKLRFEKDYNFDKKVNDKISERNKEVARRELSKVLSDTLKIKVADATAEAIIKAMTNEGLDFYLNKDGQLMEKYNYGRTDANLDSKVDTSVSFARMIKSDPRGALERLTKLPSTNAIPNQIKVAAEAALARYEETREFRYEELEQELKALTEEANMYRSQVINKNGDFRTPDYVAKLLTAFIASHGLNRVRVNKDGDAKYGPDISWFGARINSALGAPFKFMDGTVRKAEYSQDTHSIVFRTINAPVPEEKIELKSAPKTSPSYLKDAHDVVLEAAGLKSDTIDMTSMNQTLDESLERSLKLSTEQQKDVADKLFELPGVEDVQWKGNKARIEFDSPQPSKEQMQKIDEIFYALPNGERYTFAQVEGKVWEATL